MKQKRKRKMNNEIGESNDKNERKRKGDHGTVSLDG